MSDAHEERVVENVPELDLTGMTSEEELAAISQIRNVAVVLVRESLAGALHRVPMSDVASVVAVPDGVRPHVQTGSIVMGGEGLAPPDGDQLALVVTGALVLSTPVEAVTYRQVIVTGLVLAPEGSEAALGRGLTRVTGSVQYYRYAEGQRIRTMSGQLTVSADTLANEGGSTDDVLVVSGQVVVTGAVTTVGFQQIIAAGQVILPRAGESVLSSHLTVDGQVIWYDGEPRLFTGRERLDADFLTWIEDPVTLIVIGRLDVAEGVTPELLRAKLAEIALVGRIVAPPELLGVLRFLCREKHGTITTEQGDGDDG